MQAIKNMGFSKKPINPIGKFEFEFENREIFCEKHGKLKVLVLKNSNLEKTSCPKCDEEESLKVKKSLQEKQRFKTLETLGIRKRHFNAGFENYYPQNEKAKKYLEKLKDLVSTKSQKSVLLYGFSGTGKSHLCSAGVIAMDGVYKTWEWLSVELRDFNTFTKKTEADILRHICQIPFLVIDEIDKGTNSFYKKSTLSFICRERYEECLPTWLSGNCNDEWLKEFIDPSVQDRLKAEGTFLKFDWESYRTRGDKNEILV